MNAQIDSAECIRLEKIIFDSGSSAGRDESFDITPEFAGEIDSLFYLISNPPKPENADTAENLKVYISFIVDSSGNTGCFRIEQNIIPVYDSAALKYLSGLKLKFIPGKKYYKGKYKAAPFRMIMPVLFK